MRRPSLGVPHVTIQKAKQISRLERIVREASHNKEYEKIGKIVDQLCHEYAYAVHQPHARNGGLIGLAAASIALGSVRLFPAEIIHGPEGSLLYRKMWPGT